MLTAGAVARVLGAFRDGRLDADCRTARRNGDAGVTWDRLDDLAVAGLADIFPEDTGILDIVTAPGSVDLVLDVALGTAHPRWAPPLPGQVYAYGRAVLRSTDVTAPEWRNRSERRYGDPALEEPVLVELDSVLRYDRGRWLVSGAFGDRLVSAGEVRTEWP